MHRYHVEVTYNGLGWRGHVDHEMILIIELLSFTGKNEMDIIRGAACFDTMVVFATFTSRATNIDTSK